MKNALKIMGDKDKAKKKASEASPKSKRNQFVTIILKLANSYPNQ